MKLNKKSINSIFHSVGESQNSYAAHAKRGHRAGASDECATPLFFEPGRQTQPKGNFSLEICQERFWDFKSWGTFKGKLSNNFWWNCNNSPWGNCNNHGSMVLLLLDITLEVASSPFKSHYLVSHCCSNFLILKFGSSVTLVLLRYLSVSVWRNKTGR